MTGRQGTPRRRVVAWGRSVLASALVAGLAHRTDLDLVQVEATLPAALGALRRRPTHAVVCDLASVSPACVLALLEAHPRLTVVIVDPNAERALVLTCGRPRMRTVGDLVAVLLNGGGGGDGRHANERRRAARGARPSP
ncbi:MAG: hypothetical protein K0A98_11320 [Trueperaceae bacterium]|nr:hypothetical protein [Trueperaceae bacterium]